ncbi:MAG: isopentenyl-diphosphate Delta-isomerase [Eubacteriales bacterium]|nr:isopentenyl-diphosphate Delta-isomerase [Eubacteriales bacterium]
MERNEVVLVDMKDRELGLAKKMEVHEKGWLHRAFSVFLFRGDELLLQKRASSKYHCGGLWTNTCCSHPGSGENVKESAIRRLMEEMGIKTEAIEEVHSFVYRATFDNGLTEFEYDHVLVGEYDGPFSLDPEEVDEIRWVKLEELEKDILKQPKAYTPWFLIALKSAVEGRKNYA